MVIIHNHLITFILYYHYPISIVIFMIVFTRWFAPTQSSRLYTVIIPNHLNPILTLSYKKHYPRFLLYTRGVKTYSLRSIGNSNMWFSIPHYGSIPHWIVSAIVLIRDPSSENIRCWERVIRITYFCFIFGWVYNPTRTRTNPLGKMCTIRLWRIVDFPD